MESDHQNVVLCSACQNINVSRILFPERGREPSDKGLSSIRLGPPDLVASRAGTCDVCRFVASKIVEHQKEISLWSKDLPITVCSLGWRSYGSIQNSKPRSSSCKAGYRLDIILKRESSRGRPFFIASVLQPSLWPVPSLSSQMEDLTWRENDSRGGRFRPLMCEPRALKRWLSTCEERHERCRLENDNKLPRLRVIDIKLGCLRLVDSSDSEGMRYVALSYVWGTNAQRLILTRANCVRLEETGAIQLNHLPQTVVDAIKVVEMLEERYLWVDALCIIQDDEDDLAASIPSMGYIFGGAFLTIVAASNVDANSGLPGIQQSRSPQRVLGPLGGGALMTCLTPEFQHPREPGSPSYLRKSKWNTRGWTLQEKLFSRRCLYFMREQIYWECRADSWCEESCFENLSLESDAEERYLWIEASRQLMSTAFLMEIKLGTRMLTSTESEHFTEIVSDYTNRCLSFDEDAERAFAGILKHLTDKTGAQFWYGLPVPIFDIGIFWIGTRGAVQRSTTAWPSWSWLAWKGGVQLGGDYLERRRHDLCQIVCYRLCLSRRGRKILERVSDRSHFSNNVQEVFKRDIPPAIWRKTRPHFHVLFWAQTCILDVQNGGKNISHIPQDPTKARGRDRNKERTGFIHGMDDGLVTGHHEFTLLQSERRENNPEPRQHYVYLLSWDGGIARRERSAQVDVNEWERGSAPQWKLIVMG